ncbi:MAG: hypothetical protein K8F91_21720, partial [Candidatus Obscuribacterales bacterium]|nr:hypothetical protein [Candidatus Obscuribacterales bacterium]
MSETEIAALKNLSRAAGRKENLLSPLQSYLHEIPSDMANNAVNSALTGRAQAYEIETERIARLYAIDKSMVSEEMFEENVDKRNIRRFMLQSAMEGVVSSPLTTSASHASRFAVTSRIDSNLAVPHSRVEVESNAGEALHSRQQYDHYSTRGKGEAELDMSARRRVGEAKNLRLVASDGELAFPKLKIDDPDSILFTDKVIGDFTDHVEPILLRWQNQADSVDAATRRSELADAVDKFLTGLPDVKGKDVTDAKHKQADGIKLVIEDGSTLKTNSKDEQHGNVRIKTNDAELEANSAAASYTPGEGLINVSARHLIDPGSFDPLKFFHEVVHVEQDRAVISTAALEVARKTLGDQITLNTQHVLSKYEQMTGIRSSDPEASKRYIAKVVSENESWISSLARKPAETVGSDPYFVRGQRLAESLRARQSRKQLFSDVRERIEHLESKIDGKKNGDTELRKDGIAFLDQIADDADKAIKIYGYDPLDSRFDTSDGEFMKRISQDDGFLDNVLAGDHESWLSQLDNRPTNTKFISRLELKAWLHVLESSRSEGSLKAMESEFKLESGEAMAHSLEYVLADSMDQMIRLQDGDLRDFHERLPRAAEEYFQRFLQQRRSNDGVSDPQPFDDSPLLLKLQAIAARARAEEEANIYRVDIREELNLQDVLVKRLDDKDGSSTIDNESKVGSQSVDDKKEQTDHHLLTPQDMNVSAKKSSDLSIGEGQKPPHVVHDHGALEALRQSRIRLINNRLWSRSSSSMDIPSSGRELLVAMRLREHSPDYRNAFREALPVKTSWDALRTGRVAEPLPDGFQLFPASTRLSEHGEPGRLVGPVVVHNKKSDPKLRDLLVAAGEHIESSGLGIDKSELAKFLSRLSADVLTPRAREFYDSKGFLDQGTILKATHKVVSNVKNNRAQLGDFIEMAQGNVGGGTDREKAMLMKVLCDEFGLQATLVRGRLGADEKSGSEYHFVEINLGTKTKPELVIADPLVNGLINKSDAAQSERASWYREYINDSSNKQVDINSVYHLDDRPPFAESRKDLDSRAEAIGRQWSRQEAVHLGHKLLDQQQSLEDNIKSRQALTAMLFEHPEKFNGITTDQIKNLELLQ